MTPKLTSTAVAAALLLAACSGGSAQVNDEAYCEAMQNWSDSYESLSRNMNGMFEVFDGEGGTDDPDAVRDLHDLADAALADAAEAREFASVALLNTTPEEVKEAFRDYNAVAVDLAVVLSEAARDSETFDDFFAAVVALEPEFEEANNVDSDALEQVLRDYGRSVCGKAAPPFATDGERDEDTATMTDLATLGKEIATYYVYWEDGDPHPEITVVGDTYELNGTYIADRSQNVTLTDQKIQDMTRWCVEATNESGRVKTFNYSAEFGLQEGPCA